MCAQYKEEKHIKHCLANALVELMKQYPFDDITINEICYEAHIARATYYHYASGKHGKEDLLTFKLKSDYKGFLDRRQTKTGDEVLSFVYENKEMFTLLHRNKLTNVIISLLKYANQDDGLKEISPYIASYVNFSYLGLIYQWAKDGFQITPQEVSDIIFNAHREAILNYRENTKKSAQP